MDEKILITGASGFVGSSVSEALNGKNLVLAGTDKQRVDIRDGSVAKLFKNVDTVIHLAAMGNDNKGGLEEFIGVNAIGTANLLDAAKKCGVEKFIFASTGLVYGKTPAALIDENHPILPTNPYEISKAVAEMNCRIYQDFFDVVILRFSNIYGGNDHKSVVFKFLDNLKKNKTSTIKSGNQKRDFIHISDIVGAILPATERKISGTFNICYGKSYMISDVYKLAEKTTGKHITPLVVPGEGNDYVFSNKKARNELGFSPKINLENGMKTMVRGIL